MRHISHFLSTYYCLLSPSSSQKPELDTDDFRGLFKVHTLNQYNYLKQAWMWSSSSVEISDHAHYKWNGISRHETLFNGSFFLAQVCRDRRGLPIFTNLPIWVISVLPLTVHGTSILLFNSYGLVLQSLYKLFEVQSGSCAALNGATEISLTSFVFPKWKRVLQVWNDMRVSNWW